MPSLPSQVVCSSKEVKTHRTNRFVLACLCTALTAVAIGDPERSRQNSDDPSAEQRDRHSLLLHNSEMRKKTPPPASDSTNASDEDCE